MVAAGAGTHLKAPVYSRQVASRCTCILLHATGGAAAAAAAERTEGEMPWKRIKELVRVNGPAN